MNKKTKKDKCSDIIKTNINVENRKTGIVISLGDEIDLSLITAKKNSCLDIVIDDLESMSGGKFKKVEIHSKYKDVDDVKRIVGELKERGVSDKNIKINLYEDDLN